MTVMQNMGYTIVAEGAETEEEVSLLREWGVDMVRDITSQDHFRR